jgi:hypothetical protein
MRNCNAFDHYETKAVETSDEDVHTYDVKRNGKRKVQNEVRRNEVELSGRDRFRVTVFNVIIDRLINEFQRCNLAYEKLSKKFDFHLNLHRLQPPEIRDN